MLCKISTLVTFFSLALSQTGPAPVVTDNQYGTEYSVALDKGPGPLNGSLDFRASDKGVTISVSMNGFNVSDDTNYTYHIHKKPVPQDGNCNATGEHLDPYQVGAAHKCDPSESNLCQLGDLSGKHGTVVVNTSIPAYTTQYQDDFLSTNPESIAFFANLSVVVHRKRDSYRLNCGNLRLEEQPTFANGSTQTAGNFSTTMTFDSSTSSLLGASSAVSINPNTTSTVSAIQTSASSASIHYSSSSSSTSSSSMSLRTSNYGSGRVEASLAILGLTAVIPVMFL